MRISFYCASKLNHATGLQSHAIISYILRVSLKRKASDAETVVNVHKSLEKFLSLIPSLLSNEDIQLIEFDWGKEFVDGPFTSKLRVLTECLLNEIKDFWRVALLMC
ncbi:hypothetical protein REPUB_Repub02eG0009900 [Reevesia pubescens]